MKVNLFKRLYATILPILILLGIDQITKYWAIGVLKDSTGIDVIENIFRLQYLENRGAAFGMMQGQYIFFYLLTPIVIVLILYCLSRFPLNRRYLPINISGVLLIAGALGNFIDRVQYKFVVDFLYFELIDFPIFNVADIYVCCATGLFVILLLFIYSEEEIDSIKIFKK